MKKNNGTISLREKILTKRSLYKLLVALFFIVIAVFLFSIGKGHHLELENKAITLNGKSYQVAPDVRLTINNEQPIPVKSGYSNKASVLGSNHKFKIEILDKEGNVKKTIEKKVKLNLVDTFFISIPILLADDPDWIREKK